MNPLAFATGGAIGNSATPMLTLAAGGYIFSSVVVSSVFPGATITEVPNAPAGGSLGYGNLRRKIRKNQQDIGMHAIQYKLTARHYRSAAIALVSSGLTLEERLTAAFGLLDEDLE